VAEKLASDGYNTDALHGDLSQAQRDYVMNRFRNRQLQLLIATDVAARGLDVQELTHVINYNLPDEDEVYVHRSGRTGRAENEGISLVLVSGREESRLRYIEKKIGRKFERVDIPGGKEICENQLFHLIDNIINTEIVDNQIDRFLPQVYELFESMSKEELIRKVVSVEFNQFLEYYRNAPDLNKASERGDSRGRERDRDRDRGRNRGERTERKFSDRDVDFTRFFINQGQKDGFNPKTLMGVINQNMPGKSPEIGQIEIMKMFSFFELESKHAKDLLKSMKNADFKGRPISVEESRPKKGGGGGGGGKRRRRR
jgi:ATP-dependent RNA helicase DeaD